ncbi:MAG: hypothetical protein IJW26_02245, partial [Clostridia bacterium]|nr:hypothetical protein [Clostridia bacterium]
YTTTACLLNYKFIPAYTPAVMVDANSSYNTSVLPAGLSYDLSNGNKIGAGSLNSVKSTLSAQSQDALNTLESDINVTNPNLIYFDFANTSTASHSIDNIVIKAKSYIRYSFYSKVKISNSSSNKFKVEVIDNPNQPNFKKTTLFSGIGTTTAKGDYGNWTKYDIYLANVTDADVSYAIKFTFGIDDGKIAQVNADLTKGYAFIADLRSYETQSQEEFEQYGDIYSSLTSSITLGKLNLLGNYSNFSDPEEDKETADSYNIAVDLSQQFEITKNPVTNLENTYNLDNISNDTVYGIINTKYIDNYTANVGDKTYLKDTLAGENNLQLLILNNTTNVNSYYETYKATASVNSIIKVAVKVAVTNNAKAYVQLLIKNDEGNYELATIKGNDNAWTENLFVETTTQDFTTLGQKFITLTMYVATGNRSFDYKLRIGNEGQGAVYIESLTSTTPTAEDFALDKQSLKDDFATISGLEFAEKEFTRLPATVTSLDDNGNKVESTRTFEPTVVFAGNNVYKFIDYTTIDIEDEIDETNIVEDEEEETTTTDPVYVTPKNIALEIITIILSIVLLGVLVTVLVRNVIKSRRNKIDTTKTYYSRDSREKALNAISEKKKRINVDDDESGEEYDYTLAEKVGEEDVTEEVIDLDTLTQAPIDDSEVPASDDAGSDDQDETPNGDGE